MPNKFGIVKIIAKVLLSLASCLVVGMLGWWWWNWEVRYHVSQSAFDPIAWKQSDPMTRTQSSGYRTARSHMIKDLLRRHRFNGWTRQQVIELLGPPTGHWSGFEQWDTIYVLGLERGGVLSIDDEALGFKFDSTDRVVKYGLSVN